VSDQVVRVLVVDDQAPFRVAAKAVVRATAGFEVVGEAKSGEEAVEVAGEVSPDLVLMDINMEGIGGIEATRQISQLHPEVRIVLLSTYDAEDLPDDARHCGAAAYVHKEEFGPDILENVWSDGTGLGL
jgi:DNA-binding NarL/FixJ family response regulator